MKRLLHTAYAYSRLMYQLAKLFGQLLYGIWRISKFSQAPVTVFGGTYLDKHSVYIRQAQELARMLSREQIPVLTGGGPGIMEAANCGAVGEKQDEEIISTMGITVQGLEETNICAKSNLVMRNFASRKWLLINYSAGFAVFPGGVGTLNELTELLTLIQAGKRARVPIILIGESYWKPFMAWLEAALEYGLIEPDVLELFRVTDDINCAFDVLRHHCMQGKFSVFDVQY
jgi:uncharacterized protein (TIGR00730 family)